MVTSWLISIGEELTDNAVSREEIIRLVETPLLLIGLPVAESVPVAVPVKATMPAPLALYAHVKVCELPGASVTGPDGSGPLWRLTREAPAFICSAGVTPVASTPPVFVTLKITVNQSPGETTPAEVSSVALSWAGSKMGMVYSPVVYSGPSM